MERMEGVLGAVSLEDLTAMAESEMERAAVPMREAAQVLISIDEVFSNVRQYSGAGWASFEIEARNGLVRMRFCDDGAPFDPASATEPDVTLGAEEREIGGLGIYMVGKLMSKVAYERDDGQNVLVLEKEYAPVQD